MAHSHLIHRLIDYLPIGPLRAEAVLCMYEMTRIYYCRAVMLSMSAVKASTFTLGIFWGKLSHGSIEQSIPHETIEFAPQLNQPNLIMEDADVSLAIEGLKDYAKPEILEYIISVVGHSGAKNLQEIREKRSASPAFSSTLSAISPSTVNHFPGVGQPTFSDNFETSTCRDSEDLFRLSFKSPSILCSQLPMCRKIMYKNAKIHGDSCRSSSSDRYSEDDGRISPLENKEYSKEEGGRSQPFVYIVGKINPRKAKKFERGRKLHKNPMDGGVREYASSISNPLYKNYNPKGYVKNDDELAVEFIQKVTQEFNSWLSQFDGELIQLDVDMMIKVMRKDLELSFKNKSKDRENQ